MGSLRTRSFHRHVCSFSISCFPFCCVPSPNCFDQVSCLNNGESLCTNSKFHSASSFLCFSYVLETLVSIIIELFIFRCFCSFHGIKSNSPISRPRVVLARAASTGVADLVTEYREDIGEILGDVSIFTASGQPVKFSNLLDQNDVYNSSVLITCYPRKRI